MMKISFFQTLFYVFVFANKGRSSVKKTVKKGDIVHQRGRGVNPSSFFKPKFTGFSNHSEMDFWHHNMNANASRLAWLGPPISSLPPNTLKT